MKTLQLLLIFCLLLITPFASAQEVYTYVSDAAGFSGGDFKIVQFDQNGENPIRYIDEQLGWPQDIVFLEDQDRVLVSNLNSGRITRYNSRTGAYIDDFAVMPTGPTRMKIGSDGLLYVLPWNGANKVLRFQTDGTPLGEYTDADIPQSIGMTWDEDGNFYVSSFGTGTITKFDSSGASQGVFIDNTNLSGPTNIEIRDGVMFVLDWNAGKCVRFAVIDGSYIDDFITGLTNPEGFAFHPSGDLLIGDNAANAIRRFDSGGNDLGNYTSGGDLITPNAVVLRDESFLATPDLSVNKIFVAPTVGSTFNLNPVIASELSNLKVYNVSGSLVEDLDILENIWNASHLQEGIYFMVATVQSGKKLTQKIVIKRQ